MLFKIKSGAEISDDDFDTIYPDELRVVSETHFTPVIVAQKATRYLVKKAGTKILDIGSGAGKFCLIGAACTKGFFIGVEQRETLHSLAVQLAKDYRLENTSFFRADITDIEFQAFDAFYIFNSFYENLDQGERIDDTIDLDKNRYTEHSNYVRQQLAAMPKWTRLVTYFSYLDEIPNSYEVQKTDMGGKLKFWEKVV
ncbi:MAG TPA: methyltransferase domain-containing protein [Bacteroidetes bacterium]|nr:methyltransferase domain-containing protein [Bacteroidota bacterium]